MYIHTSVDPPPILSPNHPYRRSYLPPPHSPRPPSQPAFPSYSLSLSLSLSIYLSLCLVLAVLLQLAFLFHPLSHRVCCTRLQPTDRPLLVGKDREPNNHAANRFTSRPRCLRLASIKMSVAKNILSVADELITGYARVYRILASFLAS